MLLPLRTQQTILEVGFELDHQVCHGGLPAEHIKDVFQECRVPCFHLLVPYFRVF